MLGRIVVQDRVAVEAKVLPKYFNHSSFASLRRQLNYFSFVRLGKGRQRTSSYINENVFVLDDILHLKRRATGTTTVSSNNDRVFISSQAPVPSSVETRIFTSSVIHDEEKPKRTAKRRRRMPKRIDTHNTKRSLSPARNCISEDEHSESKHCIALDLTTPLEGADYEVLAGCSALLQLTSQSWV